MPGVPAEAILKDEHWPGIIQTLFCLGEGAASCLDPRESAGTLRKQVESILVGLYEEPLWRDAAFDPIGD